MLKMMMIVVHGVMMIQINPLRKYRQKIMILMMMDFKLLLIRGKREDEMNENEM